QKVNIQLKQRPDAIVTSEDDIFIASVAKIVPVGTVDATASVTHLAAASLDQVGLRGLVQRSPGPATDVSRHAATAIGIGLDQASTHPKAFPPHQAFSHAASNHILKEQPKCVALPKAPMAVL